MIDNIEMSGKGYKIDESSKKYVGKRLGKLDRYLPRGSKKNVVLKVVVAEENKGKNIVVIFPDSGTRYLSGELFEV